MIEEEKNYIEKTIDSETVFSGHLIKVKVDKVILPDGKTTTREIVMHNGGVGIIAVDENGYVPMVKQYRIAAKQMLFEIPAGKLEKDEDPLEAGKRELREETGYEAGTMDHLGTFYATPGYDEEKIAIYLARDLTFKGQDLDDGEFLNVRKYKLEELFRMAMDNEICDAKTEIAILKAHAISEKK